MDKEIKDVVKLCKCSVLAANTPLEKINPWLKSDRPWSRLHIDYVGPRSGSYYLIVVDSVTKSLEVVKCRRPKCKSTNFLSEIFARFDVPDKVVSDNGTQFSAKTFGDLCNEIFISRVKPAQFHLRSNRQAERFIDTFKRALRKADGGETEDKVVVVKGRFKWWLDTEISNKKYIEGK